MSNLRKMTISRVENACKPLILLGLQKNIKIISTQLLTVLITSVIVQLEQRKKRKFTSTLFLFGANVSTQIDKEEADYEYQ